MNLKELGLACKSFRIQKGMTQKDVAAECDCSIENISAFENGRNNNAAIFAWYCEQGFDWREWHG